MIYDVLIVDDDKVICFLVNKIVKKAGLGKTTIFHNGRTALDYLLSNNTKKNNFIILLDINMPVMNGWEFLEALNTHEVESNIHVAILTSSISESDKTQANNFTRVFDFLSKPLRQGQIDDFRNHDFLEPFFINMENIG